MSALPAPAPPVQRRDGAVLGGARRGSARCCRCATRAATTSGTRGRGARCAGTTRSRGPTLSGRGTVYARTILHKAMGPWGAAAPFVVAYVELDEGPRVLTNVVTDDPGAVVDRHGGRGGVRAGGRAGRRVAGHPPPALRSYGLNRGSRFSTWAARPSSASPMPNPRNS